MKWNKTEDVKINGLQQTVWEKGDWEVIIKQLGRGNWKIVGQRSYIDKEPMFSATAGSQKTAMDWATKFRMALNTVEY